MRIQTIFYLLLFLVFTADICAQSSTVKKADKLYLKGEYFGAITEYRKAEAAGETLDIRTKIKLAICLYYHNDIENAFNIFLENEEKLLDEDWYYYGLTAHKFGFYEGAIAAYVKAKQFGSNPAVIDELIASCKWANENSEFNPKVKVNPVADMYTGGQSFGVQFYNNGLVYSSSDQSSTRKTLDKTGKEILNLYITDLVDGKVNIATKRIFSKNLVVPSHIGAISFTSDKSMMYYTRAVRVKGGGSKIKIFSAEFDGSDWINETELSINSDSYDCAHPAVSPTNKELYFTCNKLGGYGGKDLYVVSRSKTGVLGEVKNLGSGINTMLDEEYPFVTPDNTLIFSSDGRTGFGGLDIYTATMKNGMWTNVTNLMRPFNGEKDDFGYVIDPSDKNRGFLSSNRLGTGEFDAIFSVDIAKDAEVVEPVVEKVPEPVTPVPAPIEQPVVPPVVVAPVVVAPVVAAIVEPVNNLPKSISATITSTFNGTPIAGVNIAITDLTTGAAVGSATSDANGKFSLTLPESSRQEGQEFELTLSKGDEYVGKKMILNIMELEDLSKNGINLTPNFKDEVLDDISGMVIPYVGNEITPEGYKVLSSLAAYMVKNHNIVIKLNGHTEARGDKLTNLRTSQMMSEKAEKDLISKGIPDENIIPRSYGERYIVNKCKRGVVCDNASHLENRRIEVVVWKIKK